MNYFNDYSFLSKDRLQVTIYKTLLFLCPYKEHSSTHIHILIDRVIPEFYHLGIAFRCK